MDVPFFRVIPVIAVTLSVLHEHNAKSACKKTTGSDPTILLTCNSAQWIHVVNETEGNVTSSTENQCFNTTSTNSCTNSLSTGSKGLIVSCNGREKCFEHVNHNGYCKPLQGVEVEYECVTDSKNFCSNITESVAGSVYLHSPGFSNSTEDENRCNCIITGTLMKVLLIEHRADSGVLNIVTYKNNSDTRSDTWNTTIKYDYYNLIIATLTSTVVLYYDNIARMDQDVWIKITGKENINFQCFFGEVSRHTSSTDMPVSGQAKETSVSVTASLFSSAETSETGTLSTHKPESVTATDTTTEQSASTFPVIPTAAAGGGLVLVVIFTLAVTICRQKRKAKKQRHHFGFLETTQRKTEKRSSVPDHNYFQLDADFLNSVADKDPHDFTEKPSAEIRSVSTDPCAKENDDQTTFTVSNSPLPDASNKPDNYRSIQDEKIRKDAFLKKSNDKGDQLQDESKLHMFDNDIYKGDPAGEETHESGVKDNHTSNIHITETPMDHDRHEMSPQEEGLVVNDLYHSYNFPIHQRWPVDSVDDVDGINTGGFEDGVDSIHQSYSNEAKNGNVTEEMVPAKEADISDIQIETCDNQEEGMVINDLYHSYHSAPGSETLNRGGRLTCEFTKDCDDQPIMIDNDLYHSNVKSSDDIATKTISDGQYEDIADNKLCSDPKLRPAAYEEIADLA